MCIGATGPHFGGYPDSFHDLLFTCSFPQGLRGMTAYAIGTLGYVRYGYGKQLFCVLRQRAFFKNGFADIAPGFCYSGSQRCSHFGNFLRGFRIKLITVHSVFFFICETMNYSCVQLGRLSGMISSGISVCCKTLSAILPINILSSLLCLWVPITMISTFNSFAV